MNRGRGWRADRIEGEVCKILGVDRAELNEPRKGLSNQPGNVATYLQPRHIRWDRQGVSYEAIPSGQQCGTKDARNYLEGPKIDKNH